MNQVLNLTFHLVGSRLDPPAPEASEVLVDVVLMRHMGVKRPPLAVKAAEPMRGLLRVLKFNHGPCRRPDLPEEATEALLLQPDQADGISLLHISEPRLTRVAGHQFVMVGMEHHGHATLGRMLPQAWWCRMALALPETAVADSGWVPRPLAGAGLPGLLQLTAGDTPTAARESWLAVAPPTCRGVTRRANCLPVE